MSLTTVGGVIQPAITITIETRENDVDSSTPHQRAPRTLYDILHFVVWNGYGREVGRAIGASKVLDTAEMYESKYGLAQLVYQNPHIGSRTRLMFAAMKGNMARTRLLLANLADVHVNDDAALQFAISNAHADVARLLIEHGADVRMALSRLRYCNSGDRAVYRALIRELMNAHPTVCPGDVLVIAITMHDAELVSQTVTAGFAAWGNANAADDELYGNGLLSDYLEQETGSEIVATARALFEHPYFTYRDKIVMAGNVASKNEGGIAWVHELSLSLEAVWNIDELLWAASCAGLVDLVKVCLDHNGDPNIDPTDGLAPDDCAIMMAARSGRNDVVVMLAERDDIDLNWTLVAAAIIGLLDLCTELLDQHEDPCWVSEDGDLAFHYFIEKGYAEILRLLLEHRRARRLARRDPHLWHCAILEAGTNANAIIRILLQNKIPPKIKDLCCAAEAGKRDMVREILAAEIKGVNAQSSCASFTPLLSLCYGLQTIHQDGNPVSENDYLSLVILLCDAGAKLEARIAITSPKVVDDGYGGGFTPLLLAAYAGSAAVVDELIARGADINGRCAKGQTALYYAREQGHDTIVQALVARGATL